MLSWFKKVFASETPRKDPDATDHRNHPCAGCHERPVWRGHLCVPCQEKFELWCPCGTVGSYEPGTVRQPIPDCIVSEFCNRCGYRIKSICDAMDRNEDDEVERLIRMMRGP